MAKFAEVLDAFEFVSSGQPTEHEAYLCVETGVIYYHTEFGDNVEPLPDDIDDAQKYVSIPHPRDLGLGKRLVLRFAEEVLPDELAEVHDMFRRRGAYAGVKDLFERRGVLQQWYEYEAKKRAEALREWCEITGIEVDHGQHLANG